MKLNWIWSTLGLTAIALATLTQGPDVASAATKKCLFVSSYHQGYAWSDGVERGLRSVLEGRCEIRQFDMNTKRKKTEADKKASALAAKAIIESWKPDIVITADDNAAKYLIQPFYKDHALPFVFCGVNWTAKEYGFPYSNVTGMIEVAPIVPMLERAREIVPVLKRAFYIGADTLTEQKNLRRFQEAAERMGFKLDHALAGTTEAWLEAYGRAQDYDLVIVGSKAGINDWDHERIQAGILRMARMLSVTNHGWMMPYTILGVTKIPEEHGQWAAKTALRILDGMSPTDIPIVANNQRDIWINKTILMAANVSLPEGLMRKGKKVARLEAKP
ncbi:MAG: hypothetical protein IIA72_18825 [Proteobacteria bacterium]|nr:hypothetical protein [Pseudomonadota bacterium]